jgi:hypothetical protein
MCGQFINQVKVKIEKNNSRDQNFVFTIVAKDQADLIKTVTEGLKQKIKEGELDTQNLRSIVIDSDDSRGFFSSVVGDVEELLKSL